jgi:acetoacetate decarboxylase
MVLQGEEEGLAPPFDAPVYGASHAPDTPASEYEQSYEDCRAVEAHFTIDGDITPILPEGVQPYSDPAEGALAVLEFGQTNFGTYHEFTASVLVEDTNGEKAVYIPYIYVTNDAGLLAGREILGVPKKLASIAMTHDVDTRQGTLERPEDKRLATVTVKPDRQAPDDVLSTLGDMYPSPLPYVGLRHLPPIAGEDGLTQLVEFEVEVSYHENAMGVPKVWAGPASVSFDSPSNIDPVGNFAVDEIIAGLYYEFDQVAVPTGVQKEW